MKKKIRIMVVDDHFVVRVGLTGSINLEPDMVVEAEASNGVQAIETFRKNRPDIVLMDLMLPGMSGVEATSAICKEFPDAAIIMLSTHEGEEGIYRSLQALRAQLSAQDHGSRGFDPDHPRGSLRSTGHFSSHWRAPRRAHGARGTHHPRD